MLCAITVAMTGMTPVFAQQSTPLSEAEEAAVRALILETIRDNPQVIIDAVRAYQTQVAADEEAGLRAAIAALRYDLQSDPNAGSLGNPEGDTVIVEFFDYNCPYCKRAAPEVAALIADDPDLRVVMREWPILGPDSELAARASLAARAQGKYAAFHEALMAQPRANEATIRRAAEEAGLDLDRLQADMNAQEVEAHIARSRDMATQLGITGTPTFIIGDGLVPGFAEKAQLAAVIAEARDSPGEP
jgi:protein-disulfide isomerase